MSVRELRIIISSNKSYALRLESTIFYYRSGSITNNDRGSVTVCGYKASDKGVGTKTKLLLNCFVNKQL